MTYRQLRWLTILWIFGIIVLSLSPIEVKKAVHTETASTVPAEKQRAFEIHRVAHYVAFAVGSVLLVASGRNWLWRILLCAGLVGLGCCLEWIQYAWMGSILETWDMRDDAVAVALGLTLAVATQVHRRAPQP